MNGCSGTFLQTLKQRGEIFRTGATVRWEVERDGCDAVCVIRDQGIGISDADQQQLFKAFHRGSNVGTRGGHRTWFAFGEALLRTAWRKGAGQKARLEKAQLCWSASRF